VAVTLGRGHVTTVGELAEEEEKQEWLSTGVHMVSGSAASLTVCHLLPAGGKKEAGSLTVACLGRFGFLQPWLAASGPSSC
jgi:hypothetical protein